MFNLIKTMGAIIQTPEVKNNTCYDDSPNKDFYKSLRCISRTIAYIEYHLFFHLKHSLKFVFLENNIREISVFLNEVLKSIDVVVKHCVSLKVRYGEYIKGFTSYISWFLIQIRFMESSLLVRHYDQSVDETLIDPKEYIYYNGFQAFFDAIINILHLEDNYLLQGAVLCSLKRASKFLGGS